MKKIFFGAAAAVIVFVAVIAVVLFNNFNRDSGDDVSQERKVSSIPSVAFEVMGQRADLLRGFRYKEDSIREANLLLPLRGDGKTRLFINSKEGLVNEVEVFLYSNDQSRLLENKRLETTGVGSLSADYQVSSLTEPGEDYLLIVRLLLSDDTESFYAIKLRLYEDEYFADKDELLSFSREISEAAVSKNTEYLASYFTYDKDKAGKDLHLVNMNTDLKLITYGGLTVDKQEEYLQIYEWHKTQASLGFVYTAGISYNTTKSEVRVSESFCVRERDGKNFLLDYERRIGEHFYGDEDSVGTTSILLGIQDPESLDLLYTDYGLNTYFTVDGGVWYYDYNGNVLTNVYQSGACEGYATPLFPDNEIELIGISGKKLYFTVKGYAASGAHEGLMGLSLYGYDYEKGVCREYFYCNIRDFLREGRLCAVNDSGLFFVNLGESIYSLDLSGEDVLKIYDGIDIDNFMVSLDGRLAAWSFKDNPEEICILDISDSSLTRVATNGKNKLFGFIGEDMAYGLDADWEFIKEGFNIESFFDKVSIIDKTGQEKTKYERDGVLISSAEISESGVSLKRYRLEGAELKPLPDDILSAAVEKEPEGYVELKVASSESKRNYYYINLGRTVEGEPSLKQAGLYEPGVTIDVASLPERESYVTYVYGKRTESDFAKTAIDNAFDSFGTVYYGGFFGKELWNRDARELYLTMKLPSMSWTKPENAQLMESMSSLERGVDIFVYAGVAGGAVSTETAEGDERKACRDVREELMLCFGASLIDLTGCDVSELLYYVNLRHPVLCLTETDTALIITGYTSSELRIYDPATRETKSMEKEEAQSYFESVSAVFVSF